MLSKNKKGAAIIELAIILPLLIILLFGIIEFSLILYDKAMITNASREGARAGIVAQNPRVSEGEIRRIVKNYCQNYLITFGNDTLEDGDISITRTGDSFGDDLIVTVNYRYDFLILPKFLTSAFGPINLRAQTVMKLE